MQIVNLFCEFSLQHVALEILEVINWICNPGGAHPTVPIPSTSVARPINDELHEFSDKDEDDEFEEAVIFFHGPCRVRDSPSHLHVSTWTTEDADTRKPVIWPKVWLVEEFPKARIYTVKYDSSIRVTSTVGRTSDLYILAENLIHNVICAFKPNFWLRPVVLVGHSFGGIVIKQLLLTAHNRLSALTDMDTQKESISNFLDNIKLIFYYSTPHNGMHSTVAKMHVAVHHQYWIRVWKSSKIIDQYGKALNSELARLDGDFKAISDKRDWIEAGVGEMLLTRWESMDFHEMVVPEASSRHRIHNNYISVQADHFSVCRPNSKYADNFQFLVQNMRNVLDLELDEVEIPTHWGEAAARLNPGQILRAGDSRTSLNGIYKLVMQKDGNLVLFEEGEGRIWESNTVADIPSCFLIMQTDGNAVIYGGSTFRVVLWSTGTYGCNDATRFIEVRDDGNTVMYDSEGRVIWETNTAKARWTAASRLNSGKRLIEGEFLCSNFGGYELVLQCDCNLVLSHKTRGKLWQSNTVRNFPDCFFIMQSDGNAVIYGGGFSNPVWATMTFCQKPGTHYLELQSDGNLVIYDEERHPKWASDTWRTYKRDFESKLKSSEVMHGGDIRASANGKYRLVMLEDCNLVLFKKDQGPIWDSKTSCGTRKCFFVMHPNGNAVIYGGRHKKPLWSTETSGTFGTNYIEVQNDGSLVMYGEGRSPQWSSNTRGK